MKRIILALVLLAVFSATNAYAVFFPHDAIKDERLQTIETLRQIRGILEEQRIVAKGLPPEERQRLMAMNTAMIARIDTMIRRAEAPEKFVPPYAVSNELASFLRSTIQRK